MKKLFVLILLVSSQALAVITELKSYRDLDLSKITSDTLVIFDIDNTLIRQDSMVGTHQWGVYIKERAVANGTPTAEAQSYQYQSFGDLQPYVKVTPVESEVKKVLTYLTQNRIPHFALTARSSSLKESTIQQIRILNHNFAKSFPAQIDEQLLGEHLYKGVIFSGDVPKGELLKSILRNSKNTPKKIIFVDDKRYNLESVENSLAGSAIQLQSSRYAAADSILASFDPVLADLIYSFFRESKILLSDDDAQQMIGDISSILELRFANYLQSQGPLAKAADGCEPLKTKSIKNFSFSCHYIYDGTKAKIDFEFKKDTVSKSIFFGNW